ncbi:MAG: phosphoglycerate kinase [Candidatus Altiarchaeales archaeon A3]|nr:MAG: phosphoglycerate kinase [Candidatus Altiarchaeales archaeon A3]
MFEDIKTLSDLAPDELKGKTVIVRVDLNCPIKDGEIEDDRRIIAHAETVKELIKRNAKIVLLSHQGRPADDKRSAEDFVCLEEHAKRLSEILEKDNIKTNVAYIEDIFGSYAREKIKNLKNKEVILLENVRFYAEENTNRPRDAQANTYLVKKLYTFANYFINDAFSVSHRSQPSVVGFTYVLPSLGGIVLIKELEALKAVRENPKRPLTFILAGAKLDDTFKMLQNKLSVIDYVLTGGIIANIFLMAKGYDLGDESTNYIKGKGGDKFIAAAHSLLEKFNDKILLPEDVAVLENGERKEISVSELPTRYQILDIGAKTIENYKEIIAKSGTIFAHATMGKIEDEKFKKGTNEIIKAVGNSSAFTVIGGGHTIAAAGKLDVERKIGHVCTGGGAAVSYIAGEKLVGVESLQGAWKIQKK